MQRRPELQALLEEILGSRNVYFQKPGSIQMSYPAIVYNLDGVATVRADNGLYRKTMQYTITLIDYDPESEFFEKILELPYCSLERTYTADNLNHFVFVLYF